MCGAVTYTAEVLPEMSACHCEMCRRWAGGPLFAVMAMTLEWTGDAQPAVIQSSDWAERGFCARCGSGLFYRITADVKVKGMTALAAGTLDDQSGLVLKREWFIDMKPDYYAFEGERSCVTTEQIMARRAEARGDA